MQKICLLAHLAILAIFYLKIFVLNNVLNFILKISVFQCVTNVESGVNYANLNYHAQNVFQVIYLKVNVNPNAHLDTIKTNKIYYALIVWMDAKFVKIYMFAKNVQNRKILSCTKINV